MKRISIVAVCLLLASLAGCKAIGSKSKASSDGDPEWLENLRSLKGTGDTVGVSREARDIERSLNAR
ncbi:MAG: hypothetical protein WD070_02115 [Pirellulaceae bacterium]